MTEIAANNLIQFRETEGIATGQKLMQLVQSISQDLIVVENEEDARKEALKERIRTQSRLSITQNEADASMEGTITGYSITPIAFGDNTQPTAGGNRLTITVQVKYVNNLDTGKVKTSFDESFTAFQDFKLTGNLQSQEQALIREVNMKLTENIFNRAFAQW